MPVLLPDVRLPERPRAWKWWVCGLLLLATMVNYMDRLVLNQTSTLIMQDFGLGGYPYGPLDRHLALLVHGRRRRGCHVGGRLAAERARPRPGAGGRAAGGVAVAGVGLAGRPLRRGPRRACPVPARLRPAAAGEVRGDGA